MLRAADPKLHKLENAVIRAAVNRYYRSPQDAKNVTAGTLDAELRKRVEEIVRALPAIHWEKRSDEV
jgi:hypothetical protein